MRILVVEDFEALRETLVQGLREAGYAVDDAGDGERALLKVRQESYDVVVLDLMLPKVDGLTVLRTMRSEGIHHPVLVLTARDAVGDKVHGLDAGADDYLVKPFAFDELLARVRVLVRRSYGNREPAIDLGDLVIDPASQRVTRDGEEIKLTSREFGMLEYLARRAGDVVTRNDIFDHVYDFSSSATSNVVDVYIGYLRRKLDVEGEESHIETVRGRGYRLITATSKTSR